MPVAVDFGIPGVQVAQGDHVCAFYHGVAERDDVLLPFLRTGLAAGEKCIYVVDERNPDAVVGDLRDALRDGPTDTRPQLEVFTSDDAGMRTGAFDTDNMLALWQEAVSSALDDGGYSFVRGVGEMTWALREAPGVDELMLFESRINHFAVQFPQVLLCLYDLWRFSGEMIIDAVKTHPKILVKGVVVENPYYLEPDEFLAARA
jgi:MEDS: MEthanogen/methylotroph, DcmR Sensory domain